MADPQRRDVTALVPREEQLFQQWARANSITDVDHPDSHYDYRGYWKETKGAAHRTGEHFPDTYKQHGHPTFSVESKYSTGPDDGGHWNGDTYVPQQQAPDVVIVDPAGTEHHFPAGFDPQRAAAIVRAQLQPVASHAPAVSAENDLALAAAMGGGVSPAQADAMGETAKDLAVGTAKGAANTAIGLGRAFNRYTPVGRVNRGLYGSDVPDATFDAARQTFATPTNTAQQAGFTGEQIGEYFIPGSQAERWSANVASRLPRVVPRILPRMAVESSINAGVTKAHGGDASEAAAIGAVAPVVGEGVTAGLNVLGQTVAPKIVRAAIKPTVALLKRQPGASVTGVEAQANKLVDFILEHRLTSPDKAQAVIDGAEQEIQTAVHSARGAVTDAPQRAARYLQALERSAQKQGLPGEDVAIIRAKAQELLNDSPLSTDVTTAAMRPSPSGLVGPNGQPVLVPSHVTTRALRTDVSPDEALDLARGSAKWGNNKAWGEQKGAAREASKTVERANRDAVKAAVPATREPLQRQGQAIVARGALDRQAMREGNRDPLGLVPMLALASGHDPLAIGTTLLRSQGNRLGIYTKMLADALARKDVQATAAILSRLGISAEEQSTAPMSPVASH